MKIPAAKLENFCADKDGSPVMQAAWLDVEGERLLASNGHMAARVTIGIDENDVTGFVPVEAFELARKELKVISKVLGKDTVPDPYLRVTAGEDAVIVENLLTNTTHSVIRRKLLDKEKFPNVDAVIPLLSHPPSISLDAGYVADIVKSLDGDGLSIWLSDAEKPAVMACSSGQALVVLMPRKEVIDQFAVNKRGACKKASAKPKDDTTVRMEFVGSDGKKVSTPDMPITEFVERCDEIVKGTIHSADERSKTDAEVEAYLRAHLNDDPLMWPAGSTPEQCERILSQIQAS